jgi:exosortase A-associated hydrolase 2
MGLQRYFLNTDSDFLYVVVHEPQSDVCGNIVFCNPIFEERKSSHRTMVETALFLSEKGYRVLRFDYRGCGDSSGYFEDFSINHWLKDIEAVLARVRSSNMDVPTGLLGLRFGATLALQSAVLNNADYVILWEPVVNGMKYIQEELKRTQVKEMMTWGQSVTTRENMLSQIQTEGHFDLSGYNLSRQLFDDLCRMSLQEFIARFDGNLLLISISPLKSFESRYPELSAIFNEKKNFYIKECVLPPFWNLIGYVDCSRIIHETASWLEVINRKRICTE